MVEDGVDGFLVAVDDIEDAGRQACLDHQLGQQQRHAGVALGGLQDEGVAAGNRGPELPHRDHGREVERGDAGHHAKRLAHGIDVDAGAGVVGELALHEVRHATGELDDLDTTLDIALGVGDGLAVFASENIGQLVVVARHQLDELHQHAGAALRVGGSPGRLCSLGILDRGRHLDLGCQRRLGADGAVQRLVDVAEAARRALHVLAADEVCELCRHGDVSSECRVGCWWLS